MHVTGLAQLILIPEDLPIILVSERALRVCDDQDDIGSFSRNLSAQNEERSFRRALLPMYPGQGSSAYIMSMSMLFRNIAIRNKRSSQQKDQLIPLYTYKMYMWKPRCLLFVRLSINFLPRLYYRYFNHGFLTPGPIPI